MQAADTNDAFFTDNSAPLHRDEATRSWWVDLSREDFSNTARSELVRMQRSKAAKQAIGCTVGWGATRRR